MEKEVLHSIGEVLAPAVRPNLRAFGDTFTLGPGVVGVVLNLEPDARWHLYFAEFVGGVNAGESTSAPSYAKPPNHSLSIALFHPEVVDEIAHLDPYLVHVDDPDVAPPLEALFGPLAGRRTKIQIWHSWLLRPKSMLYYIPKSQAVSVEWQNARRGTHWIARHIRADLILARMAGELPLVHIDRLVACLPASAYLTAFEAKALSGRSRLDSFERRNVLSNCSVLADFDKQKRLLSFSAKGPTDSMHSPLFAIDVRGSFKGPSGDKCLLDQRSNSFNTSSVPRSANPIEANSVAQRAQRIQLLAFFLTRALMKQNPAVPQSHDWTVMWTALHGFVCADVAEGTVSRSTDDLKKSKNMIDKRVRRAAHWLARQLGLTEAPSGCVLECLATGQYLCHVQVKEGAGIPDLWKDKGFQAMCEECMVGGLSKAGALTSVSDSSSQKAVRDECDQEED